MKHWIIALNVAHHRGIPADCSRSVCGTRPGIPSHAPQPQWFDHDKFQDFSL